MARLYAHGKELGRLLIDGRQFAFMWDGTTLVRSPFNPRWRVYSRKKAEVPLADWQAAKQDIIAHVVSETPWRGVRKLPSLRTLEKWGQDGIAKAVDGCTVEPDGVCPHGAPSWLRFCGMI